jgi:carbohydrate-selective porin OprB
MSRMIVAVLSFARAAVALVLALAATSQSVRAADEAPAEVAKPAPEPTFKEQVEDIWNRDRMTGDWEGWRTDLLERGIDAKFRLAQYGQGVASGGRDKNSEYGRVSVLNREGGRHDRL